MSTVFREHGGIKATYENTSVSQKGITYENLPKAKLNTIIKWAFDARLLEIRVNTIPVTVYNALFLNKKSFVFQAGPDYNYVSIARSPVRNKLNSSLWLLDAY